MPVVPLVLAGQVLGRPHSARESTHHEESKFCCGLREHVCGMGKRDFVSVGIGAVDVVETHCDLGNDFKCALACLEDLDIDLVAEGRNQAVDTRFHLFEDDFLRRGFRLWIDFHFITTFFQQFQGFSNITGGKHAEFLAHRPLDWKYKRCSPTHARRRTDILLQCEASQGLCPRGRQRFFCSGAQKMFFLDGWLTQPGMCKGPASQNCRTLRTSWRFVLIMLVGSYRSTLASAGRRSSTA